MHQVGKQNRSEFVSNPEEAIRLGVRLDYMLKMANVPRKKSVRRMTHVEMNQEDFERYRIMAKALNPGD